MKASIVAALVCVAMLCLVGVRADDSTPAPAGVVTPPAGLPAQPFTTEDTAATPDPGADPNEPTTVPPSGVATTAGLGSVFLCAAVVRAM